MADVMVATRTVMVRVGDTVHEVWVGVTTAHPDASVVRDHPDLWRPLEPDFPADAEPAPAAVAPAARDVRAWARANGVEVPARGKLPDDVVAAYQAAHED